jgi:hypothetical protein
MDDCTIAAIVGRRGSGKSSLMKVMAAGERRSLVWDWRGEYSGEHVTLDDLPALFRRPAFAAVYRPDRGHDLVAEFDGLGHVLMELDCADFTLVVDELSLLVPRYAEGRIGKLLRLTRPQRIAILWATQRPTGIPGVMLSEANTLDVFHVHNRADLTALASYLPADALALVPTLPVLAYVHVDLLTRAWERRVLPPFNARQRRVSHA